MERHHEPGFETHITPRPSKRKQPARKHNVKGKFVLCDLTRTNELTEVAELVNSGRVQVNIESVLPLEKARQAQELSQRRHSQGKIVLRIVQ
jgi:NADPH:quinone reductase-like Zn-dependent oxidoreductase